MKYTKELLEPLVKESRSLAEVLKKLGKRVSGGTHAHVSRRVKLFNIDTSHFLGQSWNKGKIANNRLSAFDYLKSSYVKSHLLKIKLIQDGLKKEQCELCQNVSWMGKKIPLELDHINGNHEDNRIENLRIICPNCHAQTPTHGAKNKSYKVGGIDQQKESSVLETE